MIKLKGIRDSLIKLSKEHLNSLVDNQNEFISPKDNLIDWLSSGTLTDYREIEIVEWIRDNFEDIVTADVRQLERYISQKGIIGKDYNFRGNQFYKILQEKLRYKNFRSNRRAINFINNLGIKSCPYCNAQFVITIEKSGKSLCHFDHIYPKNKYPYLSISFFNLIPCCASCNQMKSDKNPLNDSSFIHPYMNSIAEKFRFEATGTAIKNCHSNGRTNHTDINVEIIPNAGEKIDFHLTTFMLQDVYNEHHDFIDEAYLKVKIYDSSRIDELRGLYVKTGHMTEKELQRLIYGTYMESTDIHKRPLAKFQQDLIDQFKRYDP